MSILAQVKKGKQPEPPKIIFYGPEGMWKSSGVSYFPAPIFADIEGGLSNIDAAKIRVETYSQFKQLVLALTNEEHSYVTFAIDSLDWLERLIHAEVAQAAGVKDISDIGYQNGYKKSIQYWDEVLKLVDTLRITKNMIICFISHSALRDVKLPNKDPYSKYCIKLHDLAYPKFIEWADLLLFVNVDIITTVDKTRPNKSRAIGETERTIFTQSAPSHTAKNRYGLPEAIEYNDSKALWPLLRSYIKGEKNDV